jgi:hypothetical protein
MVNLAQSEATLCLQHFFLAVLYEKGGLKVTLSGQMGNGAVEAVCFFSNTGSGVMNNLSFQVAVPKVMVEELFCFIDVWSS